MERQEVAFPPLAAFALSSPSHTPKPPEPDPQKCYMYSEVSGTKTESDVKLQTTCDPILSTI